MKYIVVDFEWNQPLRAEDTITAPFRFDSEIIEIGAIRYGESFEAEDSFKCYIRPQFYPVMNGDVVSLTKIRMQVLEKAPRFPEAWARFADFCGEDCCLCTWGGSDVPVLLDNMLMHGLETPERCLCCDLQQIFGSEIMRDGRCWSLENAVGTLGLARDRAHDALNDVRNTCKICERVDILPYVDEYLVAYVNYGADKLSGLLDGRFYDSEDALLRDGEMSSVRCPFCGERVALGEQVQASPGFSLRYGCCGEGDEFLARFHHRRLRESGALRVSRSVYEMTDLLWEQYQDALEQAEEGRLTV